MAGTITERFTSIAAELGRRIGDPERMLPGEDPRTRDVDAARHWATVHGELLRLRRELLDQLREMIARVVDPAVSAGLTQNAHALELALRRSQRRVAFWTGRLHELDASIAASSRR